MTMTTTAMIRSIGRNAATADKAISTLTKRFYNATIATTSDNIKYGMGYGIVHSQHLASEGVESEHLFRHVASPRTVSVIGCVSCSFDHYCFWGKWNVLIMLYKIVF